MFFSTRGLSAVALAATAMASPLSPAIVQRHLLGGNGVDAGADLLKNGNVADAHVNVDVKLLEEPLVAVAAVDLAATVPNVVDLATDVDLGLAVICNDCGVHGDIDLKVSAAPLPVLEVSIKDFHAKLDLEVDLYAGAYIALELFKPDQVIELNLPGLLDVKAMVYLDLILSAELPISATLGAEISLGKELKISTDLLKEAPIKADVDGTFVKLLPITVNVGCAKVEAYLRLRVAAIVGLDVGLSDVLPILPDVGAGVAVAVVADIMNLKLDLCDTPSCPLSEESWGIDVGVALDLNVALNDVSLVHLEPSIMVQIAELADKTHCEHGPRPTGGNGNGGGNGGDNNGSASVTATATATRSGPAGGNPTASGPANGGGNGGDNGSSPSASASGPGNGAGNGGNNGYPSSPKPTGANGNGNGNNNGGSGNGNNGGNGSPSVTATGATNAVTTNGPQQTYTFVDCPNCQGSKTTVTVTGPAEVPKHPHPTEAVTTSVIDSTIMVPCNKTSVVTPPAHPTSVPAKPTGNTPAKPTGAVPAQPTGANGGNTPAKPTGANGGDSPAQPTGANGGDYPNRPAQPTGGASASSTGAVPAQPTGNNGGNYPAQPGKPSNGNGGNSPNQPGNPTNGAEYPSQPGKPVNGAQYPAEPFSNSTVPVGGSVSSTAPVRGASSTVSKPVAPYPVTTPAGAAPTYPVAAQQTYPAGAAQPSTMASPPSPAGGYPVQTPPVVTAGAAKVGSGFLAIMVAAVAFL
ncbi:hypothetical protein PGQ11_000204 [Apiospora arundinis]